MGNIRIDSLTGHVSSTQILTKNDGDNLYATLIAFAALQAAVTTLQAQVAALQSGGSGGTGQTGSTPMNTVLPAITGTTTQGQTLTCSTGTWQGSPTSYGYQWKRNGTAISGATNSTYVLVSADVGTTITCAVTATNAAGSATATANGVGPIIAVTSLAAPTLGYPSPLATNPTTIAVHIPADWQTGNILKLAYSASPTMSSPTVLSHTVTDTDISAGTISIGLSGVTLSGITYFDAYGNNGIDSTNLSNMVAWGDTVAPTITTSATQSVTESSPLAVALTGTDTGGIASWAIVGGADQLQVQIVGSTLEWINNGSQTYDTGSNSASKAFGGGNNYVVQVAATDYSGNVSSPLTITTTVTQIDQTPDAFTFTNVNNASLSTQYTSNTVTISGLQAGFNIAASVSGTGFTYSKNGAAYQAPGSFTVQNGDTITLKDTSAAANATTNTATVTVGTYSTTWSVATPGSAATLTTGTGTTGAGTNRSHFVNATAYQMIVNAAAGQPCLDRAIAPAANGKFLVEVTVNHLSNVIYCGFDDGTTALNSISIVSQLPGNASSGGAAPGICMQLTSGSFPVYTANGASNNYAGPATPFPSMTTGTVFTFAVDTTAKTVAMYINGTLFQTFTLTSQIPSSWYFLLGGTNGDATVSNSDAATVNFGASAFTYPQTGYTYYA